jgi:hypothetical protein
MRAPILIIGLVLALGSGYVLVQRSLHNPAGQGPQEQIDVVAIQQRLLSIGQAERQYLVAHGTYGTLEQLTEDKLMIGGTEQRGYTFTTEATSTDRFKISAGPTDPNKSGWPTLEITESMQVSQSLIPNH